MSRNKHRKCFWILPLLLFLFTGCSVENSTAEILGQLNFSEEISFEEIATLTLEEVQQAAKENDWKPQAEASYSFEAPNHDTYAYDNLSEAEKIWYEDINLLLSTHYAEEIQLSNEGLVLGLTDENVDKIYQCVLIDHPEYFFVDGYEYTRYSVGGRLVGIELGAKYTMDLEEARNRKVQIDEAVAELLAQAPRESSDYEKIKYVYETIIFNTEYDLSAPENQNIYSVFVGKASVCQGYAKATQYLLNCLGVECTIVFGQVNADEGHSWNMVKADEEYYYIDTTWGDASYTANGEVLTAENAPDINYDYLCITSEQLFTTHTLAHELQVPECTATADNYYIKEGCYFQGYDEAQLSLCFDKARSGGKKLVTVKCASREAYEQMQEELLTNQKVFTFLDSSCESIAYMNNEAQLTLTFWVTK